jgi:CRISPR-associated protein Cas2
MWVIDLENAPEKLRGTLSRWGVEVRAGLYVGSASARMREGLWEVVLKLSSPETAAVMITDDTGPQGFAVKTHGKHRREVIDLDGMSLARFHPLMTDAVEPKVLDPDALSFDPAEIDPEYLTP